MDPDQLRGLDNGRPDPQHCFSSHCFKGPPLTTFLLISVNGFSSLDLPASGPGSLVDASFSSVADATSSLPLPPLPGLPGAVTAAGPSLVGLPLGGAGGLLPPMGMMVPPLFGAGLPPFMDPRPPPLGRMSPPPRDR